MNTFNFILNNIETQTKVVLLYVIESVGSSPGRQGFNMAVAENGEMCGSIGGGFMEHKLIELSKSLLKIESFKPFVKRQIHKSNIPDDRSGMICSGEQTIAFYYFDERDIELVKKAEDSMSLELNNDGVLFSSDEIKNDDKLKIIGEEWQYSENINHQPKLYIVGGGHVGLALSQTMKTLGFNISILDDRKDLNTLENNVYADEKHIINYNEITNFIPEGKNIYVVLVSFGFRTDEVCMKQLLGRDYKYFGVMGSKAKMEKLIQNLLDDGFSKEDIKKVHTPIGVPIHSKTTEEIAISIAAEIIKVKNQSAS